MSWSNGPGNNPPGNPWGKGGKGEGGRPENEPPRGPQAGPWGQGGGQGSNPGSNQGSGPRRPGRGAGPLPELDDVIAQLQDKVRRYVPGGRGGPFTGGGAGNRKLLALAALVAVLAWLGSGFYRVQPDQQGVVLRFGAFNRTTLPGLNYHLPWPIEQALTPAVTRINRVEVGFRGDPNAQVTSYTAGRMTGMDPDRLRNAQRQGPNRDVPEEALMLTGDENIIDINFSVFWRVRDAKDFLFNIRNPAETVKSAAESAMRQVIGRTPIQPALTEARARIESEVATQTQAIMDQYKAGIEITQVQLQRVDPPAAVIDSFRDVQRANTDAERVRNEAESYRNDIIPRARGDAARLTAEAEGAKQALVAEAQGQAQRFLSVYQAYTQSKDVTLRRLYIETMQDILSRTPSVVVDDKIGGIVPYLPLDPARAAPRPPAPTTTPGAAR